MEKEIRNLMISKDKKIETNILVKVLKTSYNSLRDEIELNLFDGKLQFNNLYLIKGEIFPTPKNNDILNIKEIALKFDSKLKIKVYLKADIAKQGIDIFELKNSKGEFSLNAENLLNYYKQLFKKEDNIYYSAIFSLKKEDDESNSYILLNYKDLKEYTISKKLLDIITEGQNIMIKNYKINENKEIIFDDLTMFKVLDQIEFFLTISDYSIKNNKVNSDVFKVIDIEGNYYILIRNAYEQILYKLERSKVNIDINLSELIFIGNYLLEDLDNIFKLIIIKDDSIIKVSKDDIYYSNALSINNKSCIKFYIKDFQQNNKYKFIIINGKKKEINSNEIYFIISKYNYKNFGYFSMGVELIHSIEEKLNKEFSFLLYPGFLNKIILYANIDLTKTFFYEYLYIDIYNELNNINDKIYFDNKPIEINDSINDNFNSKNRKRICIMNIPKQNFIIEKKIENQKKSEEDISQITNSIQICKIINQDKYEIFGIFDIREMILINLENNDIFDNYYDIFGNIYHEIFIKKDNKAFFEECAKKYNDCDLDKEKCHLIHNFEENITLSQYKTRLGYLISYYLYLKRTNNMFYKNLVKYLLIIDVDLKDKKISLFKKLRITAFILRENLIQNKEIYKLYFFDELNKNNPYNLAKNLNIEEINKLNEFSRFFFAYLQLDSFILYNYCINDFSYSFSMEPLNIMKFHLKSNYDEFFFTTAEIMDKYAFHNLQENITVINENILFKRKSYEDGIAELANIDNPEKYAVSISMEFRHEKNCHQKFATKNNCQFSPHFYVRDLKFEKIEEKKGNIVKGESGRLLESFMSSDIIKIEELKKDQIYGELLDPNLYVHKNFDELFAKKEEIEKNNKSNKTNEEDKNVNIKENDNEKSDKNNNEQEKIREISDILKRYEKFGSIIVGDVVYPKPIQKWKKKK